MRRVNHSYFSFSNFGSYACNANLRKRLCTHKSHVRETSLFTIVLVTVHYILLFFSPYSQALQYQANGFIPYSWIPGASYPSPTGTVETQVTFSSPASEAVSTLEEETDLSEYWFYVRLVSIILFSVQRSYLSVPGAAIW